MGTAGRAPALASNLHQAADCLLGTTNNGGYRMRGICSWLMALTMLLAASAHAAERIPVKVVVVAMFEMGAVTGDQPGEMQFWVEREKLDKVYPFPLGEYELRMNDRGLLAICTGGGVTNAATSIMALGMDERFDLSKAYWLVAGIAGGDPLDVSLGLRPGPAASSMAIRYTKSTRGRFKGWPHGLLPLGAKKPNDKADG